MPGTESNLNQPLASYQHTSSLFLLEEIQRKLRRGDSINLENFGLEHMYTRLSLDYKVG